MSNKNTRKVKARRARRRAEKAMNEVLSFIANRKALITIGGYCGEDGDYDCQHAPLTAIEMYSVSQAIQLYTDCILVPIVEKHSIVNFYKPFKDVDSHSKHLECRLDYDSEQNSFSSLHFEALRDWAMSQIQAICDNAWLSDEHKDYLRTHAIFCFTPNMNKTHDLVVVNGNALPSNIN